MCVCVVCAKHWNIGAYYNIFRWLFTFLSIIFSGTSHRERFVLGGRSAYIVSSLSLCSASFFDFVVCKTRHTFSIFSFFGLDENNIFFCVCVAILLQFFGQRLTMIIIFCLSALWVSVVRDAEEGEWVPSFAFYFFLFSAFFSGGGHKTQPSRCSISNAHTDTYPNGMSIWITRICGVRLYERKHHKRTVCVTPKKGRELFFFSSSFIRIIIIIMAMIVIMY